MNLKEIKEILKLMNEHGLSEIEVEREGAKLKLRKNTAGPGDMFSIPHIYRPDIPPSAAPAPSPSSKSPAGGSKDIVSPMVGTFYRAPSPEAPPFVDIGQTVEIGQVVCIVEAMKLMNEIKSEVKGKVVEVAVDNAEPVEFGQTLFVVDPV